MLCTIVGAGPGLGAELVRTFGRDGFDVAHVSRRPERLSRALPDTSGEDDTDARDTDARDSDARDSDARDSGDDSGGDGGGGGAAAGLPGRRRGFAADVGDPGGFGDTLDHIAGWAGPTSVLIYNAARMLPDDVASLSGEALMLSMRTNVGAALPAVQHVLPGMRGAGSGTILLTGGGLALEPYPGWASLGAGKAALRSLGIGLHKALAPEGIHVAVLAIAGIIDPAGPLTPSGAARLFREVHREDRASWRREVVYLPPGGDPFYNDPDGLHRATSRPVRATE